MTTVCWFRRDLRLGDNPALAAAAGAGDVAPLFVVDPALVAGAGPNRLAFLAGCLRALDEATGGRLVVRTGDPTTVVPALAAEVDADEVHVARDFGPGGSRRDAAVAAALAEAGRALVATGSPYAVDPGTCRKADGTPFKVYSPFLKVWAAHGWDRPQPAPDVRWASGVRSEPVPDWTPTAPDLPPPGERAALDRWHAFRDGGALDRYDDGRNRPDLDATSRLSPYLRWGCIHPRTLLADLGRSKAHTAFRRELAWRELYADVLHHRPDSARTSLQPNMANIEWDSGPEADRRFAAWCEGRTGYPIVDAGMRQLLAEGWMHNRVRMITASFLVKDLHLDWRRGARHFMHHLVDGDLASNQHGWQWTAGTGTDPAPFFRIFNPVTQGKRFDPDGDYVRRYVPELAHLPADLVHEPWKETGSLPTGYPDPIVDHATERKEALARLSAAKGAR